jgi:hypothetical protein
LHGIPLSGKQSDAFPSGHALHVGAIASAATLLPPGIRNAIWVAGTVLVATRVMLLAHWATDVFAGLGLGVLLERGIRLFTKPMPTVAPRRAEGLRGQPSLRRGVPLSDRNRPSVVDARVVSQRPPQAVMPPPRIR